MDEQPDDDAMLQMMGFSSFGGQANKKRKYNSAADASMSIPKPDARPASERTGANSLPLGSPRTSSSINKNEIDLDDDSNDDDGEHGAPLQDASDTAIGTNGAGLGAVKPGAGLPSRPAGIPIPPHPNNHSGYQTQDTNRRPWYEGYYDYESNKNPWAQLEERMGLQPIDEWPAITNIPPTMP